MDPVDLDELLDRELKALPAPRAPRTLLSRVMAETVDRASLPRQTGWFTWTIAWQALSVLALVAIVVGAWMFATRPPSGVTNVARTAQETATVARVFWDVLLQPVATYIFILGVLLAFACAAAWAALEVALGGASHR